MVLFSPCLSSLAGTLADNAHMLTLGEKNPLENKYSRIYFPIRGKTTPRARKPALFQGSPGPADVPRAVEKSVCGKGQCLHYTPGLLPPRHVHLPGRQKGAGSGAQGSKVALENWICLRQHTDICESLHVVGNSDPLPFLLHKDFCRWLLWFQSWSNTISFCLHHCCLEQVYYLHSFYTPAPHKMLGK